MQLTATIHCITAPNPGFMTGKGTNSYIIRSVNGDCVVIDPGPAIDSHIQALVDFAGDAQKIKMILLTHMHTDHSPAAMPLKQLSGARVYSPFIVEDDFQDKSLHADEVIHHEQVLELNEVRIACLYTPGHVDNHFCFFYENEQVLFTGDHMMQGSTVVILPPHGSMRKYLQSLKLLENYPINVLAPAHGALITTPKKEIAQIIAHRLAREKKVLNALKPLGQIDLAALTKIVYDDVDESLHMMASFSLLAHLIKLKEEHIAQEDDTGHWSLKKS